jgi:hypothetical protein
LKIRAPRIIIEELTKLYIRKEVAIARMLTTNEAEVPIQICNPMKYQVELGKEEKITTIELWENMGFS